MTPGVNKISKYQVEFPKCGGLMRLELRQLNQFELCQVSDIRH